MQGVSTIFSPFCDTVTNSFLGLSPTFASNILGALLDKKKNLNNWAHLSSTVINRWVEDGSSALCGRTAADYPSCTVGLAPEAGG